MVVFIMATIFLYHSQPFLIIAEQKVLLGSWGATGQVQCSQWKSCLCVDGFKPASPTCKRNVNQKKEKVYRYQKCYNNIQMLICLARSLKSRIKPQHCTRSRKADSVWGPLSCVCWTDPSSRNHDSLRDVLQRLCTNYGANHLLKIRILLYRDVVGW